MASFVYDTDTQVVQFLPNRNYSRTTVTETKYPIKLTQHFEKDNKNICRSDKRISCIVMIHSAPSNFERREVMRKTFLDMAAYRPETIRNVFLFGIPTDSTLQQKLEKENEQQKDMVRLQRFIP